MLKTLLAHKKKIITTVVAAAFCGGGVFLGELTWAEAATKFVTLVGLGAM
jgi:hypothetical protein